MMWQTLQQTDLILGWDFYGPVILFVFLVAMAVPVWAAIGAATILMLVWSGALPLSLMGEKLFSGIDAFALTAVPLFILTGDVLVRTGLSRKFLDVAEALTCWAKGGFGSATVLVCGMFAAISGSDAAGAAAVGRMTIDRLVESGYPRPYACALVAAGACTGILIPPSIAYIIIGLVLGISASTLFLAAVIPGLTILVAILITNIIMNRVYGAGPARTVVFVGFIVGVFCSLVGTQIMLQGDGFTYPAVTFRIAIGSGLAFLTAQLLDVGIFSALRNGTWWKAPLVSTIIGSSVDTALFFTIAFSAGLTMLEPGNDVGWANEAVPLLGAGPLLPLWVSLAVADWTVKLSLALIALAPFRWATSRTPRPAEMR